ncbi:GPW/gp25 family protein [Wolbachia endosymbiont of Oedothorax gibbosus]|uniref:baseplate assembly protein W n=1 Tax=Wolbachia endosymbiont of Oedothorax gibbosus TaxID=931100 RepID=UPI002024E763|nr:baseplate assembly protein W [Wolbachia endosymbiont of Oedothorax gibbosus]
MTICCWHTYLHYYKSLFYLIWTIMKSTIVDKPVNRDLTLEIYAATAEALGKFERRFKLEKVKIAEVKEGRVTLNLEGVYLSEGKFININGVVV